MARLTVVKVSSAAIVAAAIPPSFGLGTPLKLLALLALLLLTRLALAHFSIALLERLLLALGFGEEARLRRIVSAGPGAQSCAWCTHAQGLAVLLRGQERLD